MRLVRYLFVLIVVLSTSAWAAPTQADLPSAWVQAALHTQSPTERDLRVGLALCDLTAQGAVARTCDSLSAQTDQGDCGPVCRSWAGRGVGSTHRIGTGMPGAWSSRGQFKVAFSNGSERDDRRHPVAPHCIAGLADAPAGIQPRAGDCVG
ncbi:hypothetical protein [Xanthomonas arboricola]|uniref:Uncharacterized protein n=1 Tax=Xanthomonas arboricola TaxID=56448 RepID=A0AAU9I307_9XANT|nr:hypothetical protein [Xanthomonas arboricola]CAE6689354.1 hypothetical protein XA1314C_01380 [Xanthomonas arboricola]CAE6689380.1 hypothetical protein XA1314C_01380 [Xanthomonas arboricola]